MCLSAFGLAIYTIAIQNHVLSRSIDSKMLQTIFTNTDLRQAAVADGSVLCSKIYAPKVDTLLGIAKLIP
jgi:hypothetical protein